MVVCVCVCVCVYITCEIPTAHLVHVVILVIHGDAL